MNLEHSPEPPHERITIAECARRVHRKPDAIYKRIQRGTMPEGSVVVVLDHYEIDWTVLERSIRVKGQLPKG